MNDPIVIHGKIPTWRTWWPAFGLACAFALAVYGGLYLSLQDMLRTDAKLEQYLAMGCIALAVADWIVLAQVLGVRARNRNACGRVKLHHDALELVGPHGAWTLRVPLPETPVRFTLLPTLLDNRAPDDNSVSAHAYAEIGAGEQSAVIACMDFAASRTKFARTSFQMITQRPKGDRVIHLRPADFGTLLGHIAANADRAKA